MQGKLDSAWWALRIGLGVGPFLAGLDKFLNLNFLTNWEMYLSPIVQRLLPFSSEIFMRTVGVIEMIVGLAILLKWTGPAAYVAMVWLICIALNLLTTGNFYDVAVRDLLIAIGAYTLARLSEVRESEHVRAGQLSHANA